MQSVSNHPVLFIHGAWHGAWCWEEHFVHVFTAAGYDCHTMDLPLHDQSGKVKGVNQLSIDDYVVAVKNKADEIGKEPIMIGHSMGGIILQKYLEKYTCAKAVLLAPAPAHGIIKTTFKFLTKPYAWWPLLSMNLYGLVDTSDKVRWAFFSDNISDEDLQRYTNKLCSESYLAFLNMLMPRVKLGHHRSTPMLVLAAELDNIFSIKDNERTASKYGAELIVVNNIGHDMMLDSGHEGVSDIIIRWLEK